MATWIGLLRGVNVGGHNILPMAELRRDLESLKLTNVRTYIQSGNVVFESMAQNASSIAKKVVPHIEERHGFRPHLIIFSRDEWLAAMGSAAPSLPRAQRSISALQRLP